MLMKCDTLWCWSCQPHSWCWWNVTYVMVLTLSAKTAFCQNVYIYYSVYFVSHVALPWQGDACYGTEVISYTTLCRQNAVLISCKTHHTLLMKPYPWYNDVSHSYDLVTCIVMTLSVIQWWLCQLYSGNLVSCTVMTVSCTVITLSTIGRFRRG